MPASGMGQSDVMLRQQWGFPVGCISAEQANAGGAVQRRAAASIRNAPFLLHSTVTNPFSN